MRSLGKEAAVSEEGKKNLSRLMLTITLYKQCNVSLDRVFSFSNYRLLITLLDELLSSGTHTKFIFGTESLQKYSYLYNISYYLLIVNHNLVLHRLKLTLQNIVFFSSYL